MAQTLKEMHDRDLRIDFLKGMALLIIYLFHFEVMARYKLIYYFVHRLLGYSDSLILFIFLAGYLFGNRYIVKLENVGKTSTFVSITYKAFHLYLVNIFLYSLILAGSYMLIENYGWSFEGYMQFGKILDSPLPHLADAVLVRSYPYLLDILPFFGVLFALAPIMLFLIKANPKLATVLSASFYVYSQLYYHKIIINHFNLSINFYYLMAWQFLFFIGVLIGSNVRRKKLNVKYNKIILLIAIIIFLLMFIQDKILFNLSKLNVLDLGIFSQKLFDKRFLTPLLLLNFMILVYLFPRFFPKSMSFWQSAPARPLIVCGRNSLEVFSFGILMSYFAGALILQVGANAVNILVLDLFGVALSIGIAYLVQWRKNMERYNRKRTS